MPAQIQLIVLVTRLEAFMRPIYNDLPQHLLVVFLLMIITLVSFLPNG